MPWQEVSTVSLREEFVRLALNEGARMAALCRHFGISRKTGYKWRARFGAEGAGGLTDRSRRPKRSPRRTRATIEEAVLALRRAHPAWGGRKLKRRLEDLGYRAVPAASTITALLHRHALIEEAASLAHTAFQRFEHDAPNRLWQMDFKGHFALTQGRCHPLTVLDDHSRFNVLLHACADERGASVEAPLRAAFRRYGLPERMTMDNGPPWGGEWPPALTPLTVWLIRLGIRLSHSRPCHPQTQGKDERFHRTLAAECLRGRGFRDLAHCQWHFDRFRQTYNLYRPHEALGLTVPAKRYAASPRAFPEALARIEYAPADHVRKVQDKGELFYRGRIFRLSRALRGYRVALRPSAADGRFSVHFCHQQVAEIDLRNPDA